MANLRWRAIARALGVPRSEIARESAGLRMMRRCFVTAELPAAPRWTLPMLRTWAADLAPSKPQTVTLSLGPDGLRIEER